MGRRQFPRLARLPRVPSIRIGRTGRRLSRASALRGIVFFLWEKRWFLIALAVGAVMLSFDEPAGLTRPGYIVLAMSVMSVIMFVTEPVPLPSVALMIIVGQVLLLGLDSTLVAKSLMSDFFWSTEATVNGFEIVGNPTHNIELYMYQWEVTAGIVYHFGGPEEIALK